MGPRSTGRRGRTPRGLRAGAVVTLLAFGCTTVRVPATGIGATAPVHGGWAEPQVELWVESGREVTPEESARAAAAARAALQQALADLQPDDPGTVLVVRAQGVSRTGSRRSDQQAGVAGAVVGAVVLVAAVVALVASRGSSRGSAPGLSGRSARGTARATGVARPGRAPSFARAARASPAPPVPRSGGPGVAFGVHVGVQVPLAAPEPAGDVAPVPEWPVPAAAGAGAPPGGPGDPAGAASTPGAIASVTLPPPPPLDVERRGFFAGDHLRLELLVVDRWTGVVLWTKAAEDEVDPCDAAAVRALLDGALADPGGWTAPPPTAATSP